MTYQASEEDYQDLQMIGVKTEGLSSELVRVGALGMENGALDWEKGERVEDTLKAQQKLYAESAIEGWAS